MSEPVFGDAVMNVSVAKENDELPDFVKDLYMSSCENLSFNQALRFKQFLLENQSAFADPSKMMERAKIGEHTIHLNDETPFKEPPRRVLIFKRYIRFRNSKIRGERVNREV